MKECNLQANMLDLLYDAYFEKDTVSLSNAYLISSIRDGAHNDQKVPLYLLSGHASVEHVEQSICVIDILCISVDICAIWRDRL